VIPGNGIYAASVKIAGKLWPAVVSIGVRPTFGGEYRTIEAYIMNFDENIYDIWIEVEFVEFIRKEIKFDSVEELIKQMHHDVESSRLILDRN
jgi:riboflavin kinase/FMN adenylyltransferase